MNIDHSARHALLTKSIQSECEITGVPLTRRQLAHRVFVTSWFILSSGCASTGTVAPTTAQAAATGAPAPRTTAGMHRVPLQVTGQGSLFVPVKLNGQEIILLLDTGAQGTVMDSRVAKSLGVKTSGVAGRSMGVGAGVVKTEQAELVTLDIGGFSAQVRPSLQDMSSLMNNWTARGGKKVIGLLGFDVLRSYGAIIDVGEGALYLKKRDQ